MTKRLLAILTAVLFVFSALLAVGCAENSGSEADGENEEIVVENLKASELLELSVTGTTNVADKIADALSDPQDVKMGFDLTVNSLPSMYESLLGDDPISFEMDMASDVDSGLTEGTFAFELLGEKPSMTVMYSMDAIYITDAFGILDEPLGVTMEEMGVNMEDLMNEYNSMMEDAVEEAFGMSLEEFEAIIGMAEELSGVFAEAVGTAVAENITDDKYTTEVKTMNILGADMENIHVVTLTIDGATVAAIADDIVNALSANEIFGNILTEAGIRDQSVSEILAPELEGFEVIIIGGVTADGAPVYNSLAVTNGVGGMGYTYENNGEDWEVNLAPIDENLTFIESEGIFRLAYNLDGTNESLVAAFVMDSKTETYLSIEGTYAERVREGTIKILPDTDEEVSVDYYIEGDESKGKVQISNPTVEGETFDMTLSVDYDITDSKIEMEIGAVITVEGETMDVSLGYSIEFTNVDLEAPTSYTSVMEVTEDDLMSWAMELAQKYPNIFTTISSMASSSYDEYEYDYEYDHVGY